MHLNEFQGLFGEEMANDIEAELAGLDAPRRQAKAARLKKLGQAAAQRGAQAASKIRKNSAYQMVENWAKKRGIPFARLRIERTRIFQKMIVAIGTTVPNRLAFFDEGTKPADTHTNHPSWGEFPQGTLALLMGMPMLAVGIHDKAAIDQSATAYLPVIDRFIRAGRYRHKIDQSEIIPIPLAALPAGGGAYVTNIRHEGNGLPTAENRLIYDTPVPIEGGRKFLAEILLDTSADGLQPVTGMKLDVQIHLDLYYARQSG